MIKYIFLDVANTLLHKDDIFHSLVDLLKDYHYNFDFYTIYKTHKTLMEAIPFPDKTNSEFYSEFNKKFFYSIGVIPTKSLLNDFVNICKNSQWSTFNDNIHLSKIKKPLGVISNWDTCLEGILKDKINLKFISITGSANVGHRKPSNEIFSKALSNLLCPPNQVVYVGDSINLDYIGAQNFGCTPILIDRYNIYPHFSGNKISSFSELEETLIKL